MSLHSAARLAVRAIHSSVAARAATRFVMPAMSPTMTEGGIAHWKKQEGESFSTGDVLLEIVRALTELVGYLEG